MIRRSVVKLVSAAVIFAAFGCSRERERSELEIAAEDMLSRFTASDHASYAAFATCSPDQQGSDKSLPSFVELDGVVISREEALDAFRLASCRGKA